MLIITSFARKRLYGGGRNEHEIVMCIDRKEKEEECNKNGKGEGKTQEREKKGKSGYKEGNKKGEKGAKAKRQRESPRITISPFSPLFPSLSTCFFASCFSVSRNDQKLKSFTFAPLHDNIVTRFDCPCAARVVSRPVSQPFGSNAVFFDRENCHALSRSRKEESNFPAFLTPSFQSLDKPADRRTNDPPPPCSPFLSSFCTAAVTGSCIVSSTATG